jgi:hypothetical protein
MTGIKLNLGIPVYGSNVNARLLLQTWDEIERAKKLPGVDDAFFTWASDSMSSRTFNRLWANALNSKRRGECTHFLMQHSDVLPEEGFIEKMLAIAEAFQADVLSVFSPIKTNDGILSSGIEQPSGNIARFTASQIWAPDFPATFTHPMLAINTGLMLLDLRSGVLDDLYFRQENGMEFDENGDRRCTSCSEDWLFSRDARAVGAKIYTTREVALNHIGENVFPNYAPWGTVALDSPPAAL